MIVGHAGNSTRDMLSEANTNNYLSRGP